MNYEKNFSIINFFSKISEIVVKNISLQITFQAVQLTFLSHKNIRFAHDPLIHVVL